MLINKQWLARLYMDEEKGEGEGGGGTGDGNDKGSDEQFTQEQFKALQTENKSMQSKMDELLGETKRAKAAKRVSEEQARVSEEERARKSGDFEQLFKSSEEKSSTLQTQLDELRGNVSNEKRNNAAMRIAGNIADGVNAELLSDHIARRLKYTDEGVKVLSDSGELTVSTLSELEAEFKNNNRFASLLKGSQSTGGGASGGKGSGATNKVLTRQEFDGLIPAKRMEFIKSGGKVN